jgi:ABC-type Mn2+/Zn2+ transport system ATPase subunit
LTSLSSIRYNAVRYAGRRYIMVEVRNGGELSIRSVGGQINLEKIKRQIDLEKLRITYTGNNLVLWHKPDDDKGCSVTLLKGASGVGKSIFVRKVLIPYISNSTDSAFCYIPQNPVHVRHWRLGQILPVDALGAKRLRDLFGGTRSQGTAAPNEAEDNEAAQHGGKRYLGQCSGGQIARTYIASAISCLLHETVTRCFLFLDETLDSSGRDMEKYINLFCDFWQEQREQEQREQKQREQKQLYIAIITHHSIPLGYHSISFTEESRREENGREYVTVKLKTRHGKRCMGK